MSEPTRNSSARPSSEAPALLSPAALAQVLREALLPGVRVVALLNRSGLLLGCAGDATAAAPLAAIGSALWLGHEKCDAHGNLGCLLLECESGRIAVKAVGSFILACSSDSTVPFGAPQEKSASAFFCRATRLLSVSHCAPAGMLKAKILALHNYLIGPLASLGQ